MTYITDRFKNMSLLSKNTVFLLFSSLVLCFFGSVVSFFSPAWAASFSGFPLILGFLREVIYCIIRYAALFLIAAAVMSGSKSRIAFAVFAAVIASCVDLLIARPILTGVMGYSISSLSSFTAVSYFYRLLVTAALAALAVLLADGFGKKTSLAGYIITAVMLLPLLLALNVWAIQIRQSVDLMFGGDKNGAALTAASGVLTVLGELLQLVGLSFISLHVAQVARKKKRA